MIGTPVLRHETLSDTVLLPGGRHRLDGDKVIEYIIDEELNTAEAELAAVEEKKQQNYALFSANFNEVNDEREGEEE